MSRFLQQAPSTCSWILRAISRRASIQKTSPAEPARAGRWLSVSPPTSCFATPSSRDTLSRAVTTAAAVDLSVQVGALRLRNPILAASGTFGYGIELAPLVDLNLLGGFV